MNKALFRISMTGMLALALLAASQPARAQEPMLAKIPFAFTAANMTLPAGEYRVEKLATGTGSLLLIQRTDYSASMVVITNAVKVNAPQSQTKLVFHRYGDHCFLSQVWIAGNARGRELQKSAKEKEQALLAHNEKPEQVTIVASLFSPKP